MEIIQEFDSNLMVVIEKIKENKKQSVHRDDRLRNRDCIWFTEAIRSLYLRA